MPNPSRPEQQINIMQHNVHFQPQLRNRERKLTPDEITRSVEVRMKQLTSAILRESATFLAPGEQERGIVKVFDVKSFDFHDPEKLSQQYIYEFVSVAGHFNDGKLSFPESPCSSLCRGVECECLLNQFKTFKERVQDNKDRFKDVWFVENEAGQVQWNTTTVLTVLSRNNLTLRLRIKCGAVEVKLRCG